MRSFVVGFFVGVLSLQALSYEIDYERVVFDRSANQEDLLVPLSSPTKIDGRWITQKSMTASGRLSQKTSQLKDRTSLDQAWFSLLQQLNQPEKNIQLLYQCSGRDCGSSNAWANEIFGVKQLYGLDSKQHYAALIESLENGQRIYRLYGVERGNKRQYIQVDILNSNARSQVTPSESVLKEQLARSNYLIINLGFDGTQFTVSDALIDQLAVIIEATNDAYYLVGHDSSQANQTDRLRFSVQAAEFVRDLLIQHAVNPQRLEVTGVGGLAPEAKSSRIAVVLVQK